MPSVTVLLQPGAADWEFGVVLPALARFGLSTRAATPDGRGIETIGGLRIEADTSFDTVDWEGADAIVLIGSQAWTKGGDRPIESRIAARAESGRPLAAICGATLALARAGVLDEREHTSNSLEFLQTHVSAYRGGQHYCDLARAVRDVNLVTASGAAPVSFACAVAATVVPERAAEIAAWWGMAAQEFELLGADISPVFGA